MKNIIDCSREAAAVWLPRHLWKIALAFSIGLGGTVGAVVVPPAPAAHAQILGISEREELEAGNQAAAEVERTKRIVRGTAQANLVERIGRQMASVSGRPSIPWQFRVVDDKAVNAFSVPGWVFIHTGLLDATRGDTDALAGVIAHEVAHVDAKHSKKQMEKGALAGLLGSVLVRNKQQAGLFNVAGNLVLLKYSRDDEFDADKRAVNYMKRTGYDPNGMVRFFRKLEKMGGGSNKNLSFLQTHPHSSDRISRIQGHIRRNTAQR